MGEWKMIVKEDFLRKLKGAFDLNIYEAKIWAALLSKGVSSAGELADIGEVPRSRSYDVLETSVYKNLESLYTDGVDNVDPSNLSGVMKGRNNMNNQLETMFRSAKRNILISTTEKGFLRKVEILLSLL